MKKLQRKKGITLVELLVTMGLLAVVMTMVITSYHSVSTVFADTSRTQDAKQVLLTFSQKLENELHYATSVTLTSGFIDTGSAEGQNLYVLSIDENGHLQKITYNEKKEIIATEPLVDDALYDGKKISVHYSLVTPSGIHYEQSDKRASLEMTLALMDGEEVDFENTYSIKLFNIVAQNGDESTSSTEGTSIAYTLYTPS